MPVSIRRFAKIAALAAAAVALTSSGGEAAAIETPKPAPAQNFLGPAVTGSNYKVKPIARSDGIMRIFDVATPYGQFQFNGVDFTKMRLHELEATAALEKMSQSNEFMSAFGRAAVAPIQFGANLIANPVDTINRSVSGVANMFDRAGAGLANSRADRDPLLDSLLGISDTQRQLAVELGVDPYTDFPPLAERLKQMAGAMAGGSLPVKAGLALVPGGVGIAVSSVSTVGQAKDTLRDKTAAQVIAEVRGILQSLGVSDDIANRLLENRNFTPADLLIMTRALAQIHAQNTAVFIENAAAANNRDAAYYQRRRAELLAARRGELGGIQAFFMTKGQALTLSPRHTVVAAFPFDDFAWADIPQRGFRTATADLRAGDTARSPLVFATSGAMTPMAAAEMQKLGWKIVKLKPVR
ncbi:MAG: hypothetical protein ACR2K5_09475 [Pseudolabrys sp.]